MTEAPIIMRSVLFVPGNNMRMIHKARSLDADAIILDLEDAVPMSEKETARIFVRDSIQLVKSGGATCFVRVNALTTGLVQDDFEAAIRSPVDGIVVPKSESPKDIDVLEQSIAALEKKRGLERGGLKVMPLVETARGVLNARDIATASERIVALGFGALDYTRDMGTTISKAGNEVFYARSHIAVVARAANVKAIDTPYLDLIDDEGLVSESKLARSLGYHGKMVIHPKQIEEVNRIFSPSPEEIEYATKVVQAFEEAERQGLGATSLEGRMIDAASYRQAKEQLELHELLGTREKSRKKS